MTEVLNCYLAMERSWNPRVCPSCKQRMAIGHGWLFKGPPPVSPLEPKRKAIGNVWMWTASHSSSYETVNGILA